MVLLPFELPDFITYKGQGNDLVMISNYELKEYGCSGNCYCESENIENRRVVGSGLVQFVKTGMKFVIAAASSLAAQKLAQEYFDGECRDHFTDTCPQDSIRSNVGVCREYEGFEEFFRSIRNEDFVEEIDDDYDDYNVDEDIYEDGDYLGDVVVSQLDLDSKKYYEKYSCTGTCRSESDFEFLKEKEERIEEFEFGKCERIRYSKNDLEVIRSDGFPTPGLHLHYGEKIFLNHYLESYCRNKNKKCHGDRRTIVCKANKY